MDNHGRINAGVHGDAANLSDVGKAKDIGDGGGVEPNRPEVGEIANESRVSEAAVRHGAKHVITGADVGQHIAVLENRMVDWESRRTQDGSIPLELWAST